MINYIEGAIALLPEDAGGRPLRVNPRDGSFRPFARPFESNAQFRIRIIEGPPRLTPGDSASVVAELEQEAEVVRGSELDLLDSRGAIVGVMTVLRLWREPVAV